MTPVAAEPEIKTPIRLAEITLPGPITVPGAVSATPAWSLPRATLPAAVRPMMLFSTVLPSASAPVMFTPAPPFDEITLPSLADPPPIWLYCPSSIRTPSARLPGSPLPKRKPPPGATPM